MTQEQLNNYIAEELNKWQPILEYGRIYLDKDKALRDKYKWLLWIKNSWPWSLGLTIVEGIISIFYNEAILYIFLCIFLLITAVVSIVIYRNRGVISRFIDTKDIIELEQLLESTNKYISKLGRWLAELDSHTKATPSKVSSIKDEYIEAKAIQLPNDNKFSRIYGDLNEEWDALAKDFADKRLQSLKQYIYE